MALLINTLGFSIYPPGGSPSICVGVDYSNSIDINVDWVTGCGMAYEIDNTVISIPRGDYRIIRITVTDKNSGDLMDVSDFDSIKYVISSTVDDDAVIEKSLGDGITIDGSGSMIVIEITEADSAGIERDYSYHELRLSPSGDDGVTVMAGFIRSEETFFGKEVIV